jgi:tetratricopeptide (TPR) repeat protein
MKLPSPGGLKDICLSIFAISLLLVTLVVNSGWAQNADSLFSQAVDAYNKNQFADAQSKFKQVSGAHALEAQQYLTKMKSYQDAMEVAKSAMNRTPDEQDANNLAFAIQQLETAIKIKPDGPWNPTDQLAKARALKVQFEKAHAASSQAMDMQFCAKALDAAQKHRFKDAAQYSCAVANDNPAYSCGGDEAVHLCQQNTELAKLDKSPPETIPEKPPTPIETAPSSAALDKAKAAYDANNFDRARTLFERADPGSKTAAADYLDKISRYADTFATAEKQARAAQYDSARTLFLAAVAIKPDGPGDPQDRASAMELFLGLDQFYSGDYPSAIQHLQNCAKTGTQKQPLVRFYLGASELAKYFVTGAEDTTLHQEALNDLKQAKQAGFKPGQDLSPKILQVYKDLSF